MDEDAFLESYWEADMFGRPYGEPDQEEDDSFYRSMDEEEEEEEIDPFEFAEEYLEQYGRPDYCDF